MRSQGCPLETRRIISYFVAAPGSSPMDSRGFDSGELLAGQHCCCLATGRWQRCCLTLRAARVAAGGIAVNCLN